MRDWKTVRLGDVCEIVNGFAFDSKLFNTDKKGIPLIRIRDVIRGFSETYTTENADSRFLVKVGDLLIGMDGEFNCSLWKSEDSFLNQRVCKIVPNLELINKDYVYYGLKGKLKEIEDKTSFVTVKHISSKQIENIVLKYPPLETQQQIVVQLDKCTALIAKQKQILEKYDTLIKSRFIEMFGDPVQNPMKWEKKNLSEWCTKVTDGTHDTPPRYTSGVLLLTGKNIRADHIDFSEIEYVSPEDHKIIYERCNPEYGDVLYTNIGVNYGTAVLNTLDYQFSMKNIALLKPKRDLVSGYYLWFVLNLLRNKILDENKTGGAQTFMSLATIRNLIIPMPPISLQNDFAAFVQQIDKSKFAVQKSLEKAETLYKSLMQEYFG